MYSILLSVSVSLLLSFGGVLLDWWAWYWGIVFSIVLFLVTMFLINRRIGAKVHPAMAQIQQHCSRAVTSSRCRRWRTCCRWASGCRC